MDRIYASNPELKAEADNWQPMGRTGKPEEVAEAVIWLCSDKASFVVGHMMTVDRRLVAR
ncbi:MAG TPA: SDR family oxidoreductase [Dehalococcoidia bacterium]|nr:SDR family oxidoreductase [Dehalococcoidia bacterium]HIA17086.1 SDR family oxidoreductase [Dehalococcoidia bacterium]